MLSLKAKKIKKVYADAKKAGIIIKSFKNGCFVASSGLEYTPNELLLIVYGNSYAPKFLKKEG
jgi:hypothetical protein